MGFGKTTAVNWWAKRQAKSLSDAVILRQVIVTGSITDFWTGFCRAFKGYPIKAPPPSEFSEENHLLF